MCIKHVEKSVECSQSGAVIALKGWKQLTLIHLLLILVVFQRFLRFCSEAVLFMTPPPRWPQVSLPAMEDQAAFGTVAKHTIAAKNAAVTATRCAIMCSCGRQEGRWGIAGPDNELSAELFARLRFKPVLFECFWEAYCESCTTWTASKCASLFYRSISVQTQKEKNLFFLFFKNQMSLDLSLSPDVGDALQTCSVIIRPDRSVAMSASNSNPK